MSNKSVNLHSKIAPKKYISSQSKRPIEIVTNNALCLRHQHDLIVKETVHRLHQPALFHFQDDKVEVGSCLAPQPIIPGSQAGFRIYTRKRLFICKLHSAHMVWPDSDHLHFKDTSTTWLSQGLWNQDSSIFLSQLMNSTLFGSTVDLWTKWAWTTPIYM